MAVSEFSLAVTGAGGAGVISVGELLLQAWAASGGRGLLRKAFGPQIRGGESAALLKLTDHERYTAADRCDLLLALDWDNFQRFGDEIRLHDASVVICENAQRAPQALLARELRMVELPLRDLASSAHAEGRVNMLALGLLAALLGLEQSLVGALASRKLAAKAPALGEAALACIAAGYAENRLDATAVPARRQTPGWYLSGNQAASYGALRAGVRFVAAYPITPASDALEYLAAPLERLGGTLVQAEDELAALNMALGAAYGGVVAFTATSGPGLALMTESIGLAIASETPVTILNVMRGGPSTGIPTKSEQSDLDIALHGMHGDAPHLVLAPLSIADCIFTTGWAVQLAEALQTAAIVLSDQFLGHSTAVVSPPREPPAAAVRAAAGETLNEEPGAAAPFRRYEVTETGISERSVPGQADRRYTADGLEHDPRGIPSARAGDHSLQLDKRRRKLLTIEAATDWGSVDGEGDTVLLCFGSAYSAVSEARELLSERGTSCRSIALRLLSPLPVAQLAEAIGECHRLFVVEQNHGAQLLRYLRGEMALGGAVTSIALPGPIPLGSADIVAQVEEVLRDE